jgi:hypothetical protein
VPAADRRERVACGGGRLADGDDGDRRGALDARRRVDDVARDQALALVGPAAARLA